MSLLPNAVLEIRLRIPGMQRLPAFWSFLAPTVADSRRALVVASTTMMVTNPKWYRARLDFLQQQC